MVLKVAIHVDTKEGLRSSEAVQCDVLQRFLAEGHAAEIQVLQRPCVAQEAGKLPDDLLRLFGGDTFGREAIPGEIQVGDMVGLRV